jgi:hypothetical protein
MRPRNCGCIIGRRAKLSRRQSVRVSAVGHSNPGNGKTDTSAFLKYLSSVEPGKHIVGGRRGSEENVKMKFVLPLLEYLGFNRVEDMDFEVGGMDVRVSANGKDSFIVECKAWEQLPTDHLNQCLEYTLASGTPFIFVTSGRSSALYSSLLNHADLGDTQPIMKFAYTELLGADGEAILARLRLLVSKESFQDGAKALRREVEHRLPTGVDFEEASKGFVGRCSTFIRQVKTHQMTEEEFRKKAQGHPPRVYRGLMQLLDELQRIDARVTNVHRRFRSKDIGIEYELDMKPRPKKLGLFGVYPGSAHVSFGMESWKKLGASPATLERLKNPKQLPRRVTNEAGAAGIIQFLRKALEEVERKSHRAK